MHLDKLFVMIKHKSSRTKSCCELVIMYLSHNVLKNLIKRRKKFSFKQCNPSLFNIHLTKTSKNLF